MKNIRVEAPFADINTGVVQTYNGYVNIQVTSPTGESKNEVWYPTEIQVINDCGAGVEWNILSNSEEVTEYDEDQTNFDFIRLPTSAILSNDSRNIGKIFKFLVKGYQATASSNLIIEFKNYQRRYD